MTPLVEELVPCPDPWEVARKLAHLPHLLFLDSADRHPERGRYSYVMADPLRSWSYTNPDEVCVEINRYDPPHPDGLFGYETALIAGASQSHPDLPPFQGGIAGLICYEFACSLENLPRPRSMNLTPRSRSGCLFDWVISFDHQQQRSWIVSTGRAPEQRRNPKAAERRLKWVRWNLRRLPQMPRERDSWSVAANEFATQHLLPGHPGVLSNFSPAGYRDAVRRAVEYVHAGDVFQVNLSQRLLAPLAEHPLDLYGRLRQVNPAPFGCYFDAGDFQVLSASPERFLQLDSDGGVRTTPIKGTRRRGLTPDEDAAQLRDLLTSPKDRAENVMIVDLLRNDLGRVCEYGSVSVPRVCDAETYRTVHHMVSEVRGKLRPGMTAFDLLRAAFPGGSVTGAPKVRAMEIIAELEPTARGPYCGSVGFVGFDGAMDTNILIRTFTAGRGWVQFPVGGGIVADSDPDREYEETLHKAAGMLRALRL